MTDFRFQHPWWLMALIPLSLAVVVTMRRDKRDAIWYSSTALLASLPTTWAQMVRRSLPGLRLFGMALVVVAMARPQHGLREFRVRKDGIAIMMCLDRSGSMSALDFQLDGNRVNRLAAVKRVFRDFVVGDEQLAGRPDDLVGLISFGGFAEGRSPLTLDHAALEQVLETVEIPRPIHDAEGNVINQRYLAEEQSTAIGDAVTLAVDRLRESASKSKVIILLSDGENTAGVVQPEDASLAAKEFGIKIYAIGVGSTGKAPFPAVNMFGRTVLVNRDVKLDEKTLKMLADNTGGRYFNARNTEALGEVYGEIDKLEKTVSEGRMFTEYRELYQSLVLWGLGFLMLELVLRCTRFRALP
ncbi:MAG: VWA domain-containing protein [Pirellulaceae bacterium]|jgi:Ca-activated chloride channel family protein|nr:VWA domain-containing protein [Pirellulaceae bacterium]MDP6554355.1 VWA domain-containing protein [Pirellulaceae bacterium]